MAIRVYKPTSPARRFMSVNAFEEITKKTPEKALTVAKKKHAGRNNQGKISVRHRGGGNKVKYRIIDFKRNKLQVPARVAAIEYDPTPCHRLACKPVSRSSCAATRGSKPRRWSMIRIASSFA